MEVSVKRELAVVSLQVKYKPHENRLLVLQEIKWSKD